MLYQDKEGENEKENSRNQGTKRWKKIVLKAGSKANKKQENRTHSYVLVDCNAVCKQSRQCNDRHKNERDTTKKYVIIRWCGCVCVPLVTRRTSVINTPGTIYVPGTKHVFCVDNGFSCLFFTLVHYTSVNWYQVGVHCTTSSWCQVYIITPPLAKICKVCVLSSVVLLRYLFSS